MSLGSLGKGRIVGDPATISDGDSIVSYLVDDSGNALTSTLIGSDQALDVNIVQTSGQFAEDDAHTTGDTGSFSLTVRSDVAASTAGTDGDYAGFITDATGKLWVSGTHLEDAAHVSGDAGLQMLAVRNDAGATLVSADGDYSPLSVTATGALNVSGSFSAGNEYAEDSAHSSGENGGYVLSVRQDTAGTGVSADGDYASFQQTKDGYIRALGISETAVLQAKVNIGLTATALPASALANRKHILVQNISNNTIWIGSATVTASGATEGINVAKGGTYEADLSDDVALFAIASGSTEDIIVLESA